MREDRDPNSDSAPPSLHANSPDEDALGSNDLVIFGDAHDEIAAARRFERRVLASLVFSFAVVVIAVVMAVPMWEDVRYWLAQDDAPQDVELVSYLDEGAPLEGLVNQYVDLRGTPDQSSAVKVALGESGEVTHRYRYFRLLEAGNRVFVQTRLPVSTELSASPIEGMDTRTLQGRFVGRVHRLGDLAFFSSLRDHYNALANAEIRDISRDSWQKLEAPKLGTELSIDASAEAPAATWHVEEGDLFEVVVDAPEWMLQLGTRTWQNEKDAIERVASLGLPFLHIPASTASPREDESATPGLVAARQLYHSFWIRADGMQAQALQQRLEEGMDIPEDNRSLELGAAVLVRTRTYVVRPGKLQVDGESVSIDPIARSVSPGFDVQDKELIERTWTDDGVRIPLKEVRAMRVRRPVLATRDSLIVLTETPPSSQRSAAIAFGLLVLLAIGNVAMTIRLARRWKRLRTDDDLS